METAENKLEKSFLRHITNKRYIFKGIKIVIFLALLATVIFEYALDIYHQFHNDATTFISKTFETDEFIMPPISICPANGLKPTVLKKYGMTSTGDFFKGNWNENMISVWDGYLESSYLVNRDFEIRFSSYMDSNNGMKLSVGNNYEIQEHGKVSTIDLKEYHTLKFGTCYQIRSNATISPPDWVDLVLTFNNSLNNFPQVHQKN